MCLSDDDQWRQGGGGSEGLYKSILSVSWLTDLVVEKREREQTAVTMKSQHLSCHLIGCLIKFIRFEITKLEPRYVFRY